MPSCPLSRTRTRHAMRPQSCGFVPRRPLQSPLWHVPLSCIHTGVWAPEHPSRLACVGSAEQHALLGAKIPPASLGHGVPQGAGVAQACPASPIGGCPRLMGIAHSGAATTHSNTTAHHAAPVACPWLQAMAGQAGSLTSCPGRAHSLCQVPPPLYRGLLSFARTHWPVPAHPGAAATHTHASRTS